MAVSPIPEGYHSVTPYLIVDGAAEAIRFYERAFGAAEVLRMPMPVPSDAAGGVEGSDSGKLAHAEIRIGDSVIMLADEFPNEDHLGPKSRGGPTASFLVYTTDVDAAWKRAIDAGCTSEREPENQFWGDRMGTLRDPFGHRWSLATHVEDVAPDEMNRRMQAMMGEKQPA